MCGTKRRRDATVPFPDLYTRRVTPSPGFHSSIFAVVMSNKGIQSLSRHLPTVKHCKKDKNTGLALKCRRRHTGRVLTGSLNLARHSSRFPIFFWHIYVQNVYGYVHELSQCNAS